MKSNVKITAGDRVVSALAMCLFSVSFASHCEADPRTWRNASRDRTVVAEFVKLDGQQLTLHYLDGSERKFPLGLFSQDDQDFAVEAQRILADGMKWKPAKFVLLTANDDGLIGRSTPISLLQGQGKLCILVAHHAHYLAPPLEIKLLPPIFRCGFREIEFNGKQELAEILCSSLSVASKMRAESGSLAGRPLSSQVPQPAPRLHHENAGFEIIGSGTGFCVGEGGYYLTNRHVVKSAEKIEIFVGDRSSPVRVIAEDEKLDLALLKTDLVAPTLPLPSSDGVSLGDSVATLGFPDPGLQGTSPKLTKGVISSLTGLQNSPLYYQHDAAIQPGNSGGPLFNDDGLVVGIVVASLSEIAALKSNGSLPQNVNFAIKGHLAHDFLARNGVNRDNTLMLSHGADYRAVCRLVERATGLIAIYGKATPRLPTAEYSINPKSKIRHNARCRFFKSGVACSANDGTPCGICGG